MAVLFAIEFRDFLTINVLEQLYVDTTRIPSMKINFDITFPKISCGCKYFYCDAHNVLVNNLLNNLLFFYSPECGCY